MPEGADDVHQQSSRPGGAGRRARASLAERIVQAIERSKAAEKLGKKVGLAFSRVVRPGTAKDLLSGTWMGHPAHPMLTDLPIGAWMSSLALDLAGGVPARTAADTLVGLGVLSAVPTAITGVNDLADVVNKEERAVGLVHAIGNVASLALYAASYAARKRHLRTEGVALSMLGAASLAASGFLGGHLSYRRGIGVAQTAFQPRIAEWTAVLDDDRLPQESPRRVSASGVDVLLYRSGDRICALANRCSHRGGPLHKGRVTRTDVRCPWHHSIFRLEDGLVLQGPTTAPQPRYDVRVVERRIEIRSPPPTTL